MAREHKGPIVEEFAGMLTRAKTAVYAEYHGLTMKQLQVLRKDLRAHGGEMKVVKNTLARIACERAGMESLNPELTGPLAFILSYEDQIAGPKAAITFARKHPKLKLRGGYSDGTILSADEVKALGNLPSLEVVRGTLIMNLIGVPKEFIQTLEARIENLGGAPDDGAPTGTDAPAIEAAAPAVEPEAAPAAEPPAESGEATAEAA